MWSIRTNGVLLRLVDLCCFTYGQKKLAAVAFVFGSLTLNWQLLFVCLAFEVSQSITLNTEGGAHRKLGSHRLLTD